MNAIKNHPPTTAATVLALVLTFLGDLIDWLASFLTNVPDPVLTSGKAAIFAGLAYLVGRYTENFTWPDWKVQAEFLSPVEAEDHWSVPITEAQDYTEEA